MSVVGAPIPPAGAFPVIYNSYVIDPHYGRIFTFTYTAGIVALIALYSPKLLRSIRSGRTWQSLWIFEDLRSRGYETVNDEGLGEEKLKERNDLVLAPVESRTKRTVGMLRSLLHGPTLYAVPKSGMDVGQVLVVLAYLAVLLTCLIRQQQLLLNPNRAGFLALAQLPFVFLFGAKNSILTFLFGRGYEKLNFIHRWAGRSLFLCATIHGSLWIRNHLMGGERELLLHGTKELLGQAAYGTLCILVLSSLRPVRRLAYQFFFVLHSISYVAFFIIICNHTPYAPPWIYPPIAFYAFDLFLRLFRYRIKDAYLEPLDSQMTLVRIPDCTGGWVAGQHIQLRVFFSNRMFESHPLTILNAPSSISNLAPSYSGGGIVLGSRSCGDWSRALNSMAQAETDGAKVTVMMDGPYGGSSLDFGEYESVLLVSGGSGVTFSLGILDDLVGRIVKLKRKGGEKTKRIEFVWYIRSYACIQWFAPMLSQLAHAVQGSSLILRVQCFVTCLCDPRGLPTIPNSSVSLDKPSLATILAPLISPTDEEKQMFRLGCGGVGVAASGPERLTSEAQNAVARIGPKRARDVGGVEIHTEMYCI